MPRSKLSSGPLALGSRLCLLLEFAKAAGDLFLEPTFIDVLRSDASGVFFKELANLLFIPTTASERTDGHMKLLRAIAPIDGAFAHNLVDIPDRELAALAVAALLLCDRLCLSAFSPQAMVC